jgi:membrane fusion protein (multidrug efflux system)
MNKMDKIERRPSRHIPSDADEYEADRRSRTRRRLLIWVPVFIVAAVLILGFPLGMMMMRGFPPPPTPAVSTVVARMEAWQPAVDVVGSLSASRGADLAVEVAGVVDQVYYESGGAVRARQPLVRLRAPDEVARLATLQAAADLAAANHARNQRLWDIQGISQAELQASEATLKSSQAQVAEQQALIDKKMIRAPFDGRLGIRNVNVGQYLNPGTVVATLQVLNPINFDFTVPQQLLEQLKVGQKLAVRVDAYPNAEFTGTIETIDPKVDPATRSIAARATLTNGDDQLLPGMYATGRIDTGAPRSFITVPQTAVTFNPYGNTVYKVEEQTAADGTKSFVVRQTFVTTGETRGDQIAILEGTNGAGIKDGDVIVSAGQFKVQNGATVTINNEVQPSNDPNARPVDR